MIYNNDDCSSRFCRILKIDFGNCVFILFYIYLKLLERNNMSFMHTIYFKKPFFQVCKHLLLSFKVPLVVVYIVVKY